MGPALLPLLREIGQLKRVTAAGRNGSIAERAFRRAWARLVAGDPIETVALETCAATLAATRIGDLDAASLLPLGLTPADIADLHRRAANEAAGDRLSPDLSARLADARATLPETSEPASPPPFVEALAAQPRAGATCPGKRRIVLLPAENHAEHCLVVAVYGLLLAEPGCDLGTVFLASLAHHLHNARLPDAGFTGEMVLGRHLEPAMRRATEAALAELPADLAQRTVAARRILPDADSPEGRAFHAADVLDRVLEMEQHVARARVTLDDILGDMALVHEGPVKPFHDRVLAAFGLA